MKTKTAAAAACALLAAAAHPLAVSAAGKQAGTEADAMAAIAADFNGWVARCNDLDGEACRSMGLYARDRQRNHSQADIFWTKGCYLGDGESCARLGLLRIEEARGQDRRGRRWQKARQAEALSLIEKGCSGAASPSGYACAAMGDYYRGEFSAAGLLDDITDTARALGYYDRGCTMGHAGACSAAGGLQLDNIAEKESVLGYYGRACGLGDGESCFLLGVFWEGSGRLPLKRDPVKAEKHYSKSCSLGYADGCSSAAEILAKDGGRQEEAVKAWSKACDLGEAAACSELARHQLEKNHDGAAAREAYARGCRLGDRGACRQLEILRKRLRGALQNGEKQAM